MAKTSVSSVSTTTNLVFDTLIPVWENGLDIAEENKDDSDKRGWLYNDYWKAGNTIDAAVEYFVVSGSTSGTYKADGKDKTWTAKDLIKRSLEYIFEKRPFGSGPWRDDYGWWGNSFVNVYKNADKLSLADSKDDYLNAAKTCWNVLNESASTNLAYGASDPDQYRNVRGAGFCCWNQGSAKDFDQNHGQMQGVPNTVTTIGFWALTLQLYNLKETSKADRSKYMDALKKLIGWFELCWKHPTVLNSNMLFNSCGLIRETPDPYAHHVWCYDQDRAWTGDQGITLYCLVETMNALKDDKHAKDQIELLLHFARILTGGISMLWSDVGYGSLVFREFETRPMPFGRDSNMINYNNNYITGPGIMVRYLARILADLETLDKGNDWHFRNFVINARSALTVTSNKAWANKEETNRILCWWTKFEKSPYYQYEQWDTQHDSDKANANLWLLAPQVSGLDLCVASDKFS